MAKIRDYFDFIDKDTWRCSVCGKDVRSATTSNLLNHFRTKHPPTYEEYLQVAKRRPKDMDQTPVKRIKLVREQPHQEDTITTDEIEYEWPESKETSFYQEPPTTVTPVAVAAAVAPPPDDPLKLFFLSMHATVSRMTPEDIFSVRRRIFDVVSEFEEQQLLNQRGTDIAGATVAHD